MILLALALVSAVTVGVIVGHVVATRHCPHTWTLHLSQSRIWLACPLCGAESRGWELYEKRSA